MNLFLFSLTNEPADSQGNKLKHVGRTFRGACRARLGCVLSGLLTLSGTIGALRAAEDPPNPTDFTSSPNHWLEFKIKAISEGMALSWFAREGVPCQVQSSTDLATSDDRPRGPEAFEAGRIEIARQHKGRAHRHLVGGAAMV